MADQDNGTSGLGWFLAGLGFGALIGVLYAPKSGAETREDIMSGALDAKEKAAAYAQEKLDKGKEYYEKGLNQWGEYVEKGKTLVQEHQDKVAAAIDAGKEAYVNTTSEHQA
jgi:gas vesicle protein